MCGIVGAVAQRNVLPILLDGLRRLEYRGYDSVGIAVVDAGKQISRIRSVGKIIELEKALDENPETRGITGIAHTRWATHGPPTKSNAHPHMSGPGLALVCNGIIENHEDLRLAQKTRGFKFQSDTDTEVIVNEVYQHLNNGADLLEAVQATIKVLEGAFAIGVICSDEPHRLVGARRGSPLVVGIGEGEAFLASDMSALISVTRDFYILDDGDVVDINNANICIMDSLGQIQQREIKTSKLTAESVELGEHRHFMLKEIHEQSTAIANTLEGRISGKSLLEESFGTEANRIFDATLSVQIIACGTSYHAGLVAKYWFEELGVPCQVEIASEFRSRVHAVPDKCLVVTLSQSGETIDTLSALSEAKKIGFANSLTICNAPESSLVRESDLVMMTHAGPEIGVASTKAFTTQLVALRLLAIALGRRRHLSSEHEAKLVAELRELPAKVEEAIKLEPIIKEIAEQFADKHHALFLGRGTHYPIALEGALKLKEISYIHAEAYPAGELKHGPLALIDSEMPVISVAPNDRLLDKLKANIEEVRARGGKLIVFADVETEMSDQQNLQVINVASVDSSIAPIIFTIPLQLLSYHVALIKGTDVDKPRNLAKSVTVE
ncbi:MAG: glutamine--fructose-6-phosphate transaminase (isomerizing) [Gammaproteobacteria bacterium]|nr:glutamine--fructose-6-phosphate transaminase (isomerizing) [Gammaproteobacteria bacterium]